MQRTRDIEPITLQERCCNEDNGVMITNTCMPGWPKLVEMSSHWLERDQSGPGAERALSKENVAAAVTGEPTPPLRPLVRQGSVAGKRLSRAPSCVLPISLRNSAWNLADGGGALRSRRADSTVSQCGTTALKQFASSRRPSQRQEWPQADDEETSSTSTAAPTPRYGAVSGGVVQKLLSASSLGMSKPTAIAKTSAMRQTHLGRETMVLSRRTSSFGQGYFLPDASARESRSVAKLILIVAVAMVFAVFLCLLLVKVYVMSGTAVKNQCTTQSCASYSSLLLYTINKSVDPCHSFTRFVCDGWTQKQPLSVEETHFVDVLDRLRESALSADIPASGQNEEQRALALFLSCDDVRQGK
ncbi:hypothetical protein HPB50_014076 [Hyalomma asiaticum]|uniref:Uncharacterized protein n=1 Tax=Hyalomma asiaticum TaxID=266040 RepID=A0ACB7S5M7_HYAAI|nr:hypothetical protein HPB50_014076 [Hyalomma asiaticum]